MCHNYAIILQKITETFKLYLFVQAGKTQDTTNSDTNEKVSNGVAVKEINNGDNRPEKENKEQREKRNSSNPTHQ